VRTGSSRAGPHLRHHAIRWEDPSAPGLIEITHMGRQAMTQPVDRLERRFFFDQLSFNMRHLADPAVWDEVEIERALESGAVPDRSREPAYRRSLAREIPQSARNEQPAIRTRCRLGNDIDVDQRGDPIAMGANRKTRAPPRR
jgi:hypothetical protein